MGEGGLRENERILLIRCRVLQRICVKGHNLLVCPWKSIEKRRIYRIMIYGQNDHQYILRIPMNEKGICLKFLSFDTK